MWNLKKDNIESLLSKGERADGRKPDEYREFKIELGKYHHAEGSAFVTLGKTKIAAGVKMSVEKPYPDSPDNGNISVNAEMSPIASPSFESGPPREEAVELARVVDRGIREAKIVDVDKLCITPGEEVWTVFVDLRVLDYDGNLFDACTLAAIAALVNTKIPKYEDGKIIDGEYTGSLPLNGFSTMSTFVKIGNHIVVDPSLDEDKVMSARISVSVNEKGQLCAMQKGGIGTFTAEEIDSIITDRVFKAAKPLQKVIKDLPSK
ncbi:MAG: exosome complex protein Rrp42 [Candidatus Diapherotrites archaeon]|nr:exosome complex protein Rrp42 [Candidatus Diapherotrites archaeon]